MKTTMKTLVVLIMVVLASMGYIGKVSAQASFVVSNQQAEALGAVTVSTVSGNSYLPVNGNSTDTDAISGTAISITIFGQTVPQGQQAYVTLPDQTVVVVTWQTPSEVVVVDKDEIN